VTLSNAVAIRFSPLRRCGIWHERCDSNANAMNNPELSHNCPNIFLSRISQLIHFVSRVNLEAEV
jgi:hypothetical protein